MRTSLPPFVLLASVVSAAALGGCNVNALYKKDTGTIEPVPAPSPYYANVAADPPGSENSDAASDPDAAPEVLAGEGPDAIQPLDASDTSEESVAAEPEVLETYVVVKDDTLGHISQKLYGTVNRTKDLMDANPGINPKRMQIGDVINVPR